MPRVTRTLTVETCRDKGKFKVLQSRNLLSLVPGDIVKPDRLASLHEGGVDVTIKERKK